MKTLRTFFPWILLFLAGQTTHAAEPLQRVRIASIAQFVDGKSTIGGGQAAVVEERGELARALRKRGIQLEWYPVPVGVGGPAFNEALANRSVDFASYGDFPAIIAKAGGIDIQMIVPAGRGTNSYLIVPAASAAKNIADLRGKRIAIQRGRPLELAFSQLLQASGLRYSDFRILNVADKAGAAALAAGDVDAQFTGSAAFQLEDKNVGRIIWSSKGTAWKWRAELFVRREFAERYPDITQLVTNAFVEAAHWSSQEENRKAVIRLTARNGTPEDIIERDYAADPANAIDGWKERFSPLFDELTAQHYRDAVAFARAQNLIRRDIDVKAWFEPRFVEKALRELQLEDYWSPRGVAAR